MTVNSPTTETEAIRAWRKVGARSGSDHDAEQVFDEANALGYTDRMMLIAASRIALRITHEYANVTGLTLDSMLEAMLREFLIQEE
jgi:adenine-specific DNA methylase